MPHLLIGLQDLLGARFDGLVLVPADRLRHRPFDGHLVAGLPVNGRPDFIVGADSQSSSKLVPV